MATTANHVLLERIVIGEAGASSVSFVNIPQTGYSDLKIVASVRDTRSGTYGNGMSIAFNTGGTYSAKYMEGNGASVSSGSDTSGYVFDVPSSTATASTFGNAEVYIPNYLSSNAKSYSADSVTENNATNAYGVLIAGLWTGTSAITTIKLTVGGSNSFTQYSSFSLYGIAAKSVTPAIAPFASGGDVVVNDGSYWYHAFLSSGTFTPAKALSCDVLVVAGGGGGGFGGGGGGGAGGVYYTTTSLTSNTSNTVTIGAGGNNGTSGSPGATNGSNSQFASLTAAVGGGGGGGYNGTPIAAGNGGSGGGAVYAGTYGTGTSGQGNAGGTYDTLNITYRGGGGGGAGGAGSAGTAIGNGNGGAGTNSYSSWLTPTALGVSGYLAGGGGGATATAATTSGTGGSSVGGNGGTSSSTVGTAGVANTGGGGGAGYSNANGAKGGSGIVIVRYSMV